MGEENTPVTQELEKLNIPFRVFRHPGSIASLEQAACERGQRPAQIVRSLLFRLGEEEYVMVLAAGPEQVSWVALRRYLGQSRLTMATPEEVLAVTGYQLGAVSPFGLSQPLKVLVDDSLLNEEEISIGSGTRGLAVILRTDDLLRGLGEVGIGRFRQ